MKLNFAKHKIYATSSQHNELYPEVVEAFRKADYAVYEFRPDFVTAPTEPPNYYL